MDALIILKELLSLNTVLSINDDGRLAYEAPNGVMTADRLASVRTHRDELLALVERMEERTAIMQFDGGLPQEKAERLAKQEVLQASNERPPSTVVVARLSRIQTVVDVHLAIDWHGSTRARPSCERMYLK